jgi:FkbM family methyltransferase
MVLERRRRELLSFRRSLTSLCIVQGDEGTKVHCMSSSLSHRMYRLRQILAFARSGRRPWDAWRLALLGYSRGHALSSPDLLSRLLYRIYPRLVVNPAGLRGMSVELDPGDWAQAAVYEQLFIQGIYDLSRVSFRPQLIMDCGAHVGTFMLLAAATFPGVPLMAFEPNPRNAALLRRQVERNHLSAVEVIEAAVSTADGEASFSALFSWAGALKKGTNGDDGRESYRVRVIDLPRLLRDRAPANLVLKMDIEGEEAQLMPELLPLLPRTCAIFIEIHQGIEGWRQMSNRFEAAGFTTQTVSEYDMYVDGWALRT